MTNRHGELKSGKRYCQHKHCEFKLRFSVQTNGSVKITSSTLSHNHARHQPTVFNGKTLKTLESEVTEWEAAFFKDHGPYSPSALLRKTLDEKFPTVVFSQNLFHRLKKKACEERFGKTGAGDMQKLMKLGLEIKSKGGVFEFETDDQCRLTTVWMTPPSMMGYLKTYNDFVITDATFGCNRYGHTLTPNTQVDCLGRNIIAFQTYGITENGYDTEKGFVHAGLINSFITHMTDEGK